MRSVAISLAATFFGLAASAGTNFPHTVGGTNWSSTLTAPQDGRARPAFTNGCVKLDSNKQAVIVDGFPVFDAKMCSNDSWDVKIEDSEAASACNKLGGHLPTQDEYNQLIRSLEKDVDFREALSGPVLYWTGHEKLASLFGDSSSELSFWTSSVYPARTSDAFVLADSTGMKTSRNNLFYSVRCAEGPKPKTNAFPIKSAGLSWSWTVPAPFDGRDYFNWPHVAFTNGCVKMDRQGRVILQKNKTVFDQAKCSVSGGLVKTEDSEAALACQKIGGRLPTASEMEKFLKQFDHQSINGRIVPTLAGRSQIRDVFRESPSYDDDGAFSDGASYWLANIVKAYPQAAGAAYYDSVNGVTLDYRTSSRRVRCVSALK